MSATGKTKRGVHRSYNNGNPEVVCECKCHDRPGVMHCVACCHEPRTDEGKRLLELFDGKNAG